ncbi:MAG: hypothetical protein FWD25_02230 [Clostridia bacterium]|nr:hypothetical protein [Clostridia bacterium]
MPKKKLPTHESFEATNAHGQFAKITVSMMSSLAWKSLKPSQMGLYLLFKAKYTRYRNGDDNRRNISFPFSEYKRIETYSNQRTFWRDLDALIDRGFIEVVESGRMIGGQKKASIYGLSDAWKQYGLAGFHVDPTKRRNTGRKS